MRYLKIDNDNELALLNAFTRIRDKDEINNFVCSKRYDMYLSHYNDILDLLKTNEENLRRFKSSLYSYLYDNKKGIQKEKESEFQTLINTLDFIENKTIPNLNYNFDKKDFLFKVLNEWGYYNLELFNDSVFSKVRNKLIALAIPMKSQLSCIDFLDYNTIEDLVSCTSLEDFEKAKQDIISLYEFMEFDFFSERQKTIMKKIIDSLNMLTSIEFWKFEEDNRINALLKIIDLESEILFVSGIDLETEGRIELLNKCKVVLYSCN